MLNKKCNKRAGSLTLNNDHNMSVSDVILISNTLNVLIVIAVEFLFYVYH